MPLGTATANQPGFQDKPLCFPEATIEVVNNSGAALPIGAVRRFNTQFSDGAALPSGSASGISAEEGDAAGIWGVIQDDAADTAAHDSVSMVCVLAEAIADGDHGKAYVRGIVSALVNDTAALPIASTSVATSGIGLAHAVTTDAFAVVVGAGSRISAILLGTTAGGSGNVLATVLLDGINGFGRSKNNA